MLTHRRTASAFRQPTTETFILSLGWRGRAASAPASMTPAHRWRLRNKPASAQQRSTMHTPASAPSPTCHCLHLGTAGVPVLTHRRTASAFRLPRYNVYTYECVSVYHIHYKNAGRQSGQLRPRYETSIFYECLRACGAGRHSGSVNGETQPKKRLAGMRLGHMGTSTPCSGTPPQIMTHQTQNSEISILFLPRWLLQLDRPRFLRSMLKVLQGKW